MYASMVWEGPAIVWKTTVSHTQKSLSELIFLKIYFASENFAGSTLSA